MGSHLHSRLRRLWLGIAVCAAAFMAWNAWRAWQDIRIQSQERLRAFAAEYAIEWRSTLRAREDAMQRLGRRLLVDPQTAQQQLDTYLLERPGVEGVALVDAQGRYVARSGALPPSPLQDTHLTPLTRSAYATCLRDKTFCLGPPIPDERASGRWMALEYLPLSAVPGGAKAPSPGGEGAMPLGKALPQEWLVLAQSSVFPRALGLLQAPGEGMAFVVLRNDGLLQLRFPPPPRSPYGQPQNGIMLDAIRGQPQASSGMFSGLANNANRHMVGAYVRVPDYPFIIGADLPTRSLLQRWAGQLAGTLLLFFGLLAAGSWLFASALRQLGRTERGREQALDGLRRQRDELDVTLSSIGDAVIATDARGRISRMNPEAVRLTGWPASEALGQPIELVFRIVVEGEDSPAPCPVARALATGRVVVLGNHTELRARDGRVLAIEDSAAPISGHDGEARGAVLVFHDVTDRRERQRRNERLKSLYAALAELGEIVQQHARQGDESALFRAACEALAASSLFNAAWIGRPDATGVFQVLARAGNGSDDLERIEMRLDDPQPALAVRAWLAGELRVHNDFPADPINLPRRDFVVAHRWHSIAAVPLLRAGRPDVILVVTSPARGLFQDDVRELIARIARLLDHAVASQPALERTELRVERVGRGSWPWRRAPLHAAILVVPTLAALWLGLEAQAHGAEVQQEGVGADVVGRQDVAVEGGAVVRRQVERAAIDQHVAVDAAQAQVAQALSQAPQVVGHQVRIAAADKGQIAREHATLQWPHRVHQRLPAVGGPQQVERDIGGHQLHQRSRVHRLLRVEGECGLGMPQWLHHEAAGRGRNAGLGQGLRNRSRQLFPRVRPSPGRGCEPRRNGGHGQAGAQKSTGSIHRQLQVGRWVVGTRQHHAAQRAVRGGVAISPGVATTVRTSGCREFGTKMRQKISGLSRRWASCRLSRTFSAPNPRFQLRHPDFQSMTGN